MKIQRAMVPSGILICQESVVIGLSENEQRELISWLAKNKPKLVREIVCEECPEHV